MEFLVKDSDKNTYTGHRIFACSYEPIWQKIRAESKFKPFDECRATLARLEAYILRVPRNLTHDIALNRWRVYNLLRAIPLGQKTEYGISYIPRSEIGLIKNYRRKIKVQLEEDGYPFEWDWAVSRANCRKLWRTDQGATFLVWLEKDLTWRRAKQGKKPELQYFINIIQETSHYDD